MKAIKLLLNGYWRINILIVLVTINLFFGTASATMIKTTMAGHITTIPATLIGSGVAINDPFKLFFTFDDSLGIANPVLIAGIGYYTVVTDTFTSEITDWSGSLPAYIASLNSTDTQIGTKQSWYRPIDTLHHEEWYAWGLTMITNYHSNPVPSYGWFHYGQPDNIGFIVDSVTTSPVPEPQTYTILLAGLGLLGFMARRRKESAV